MDVFLFRDLERLQQTGNFSQAAALANMSQPAFSRRIKALEAWVGALLVDRSRQPVRLTPAGLQMLDAGLHALSRIEQERAEVLEAQSLPDKYVITFGTQHSIGWRFYPTWLQAFEEAYGPILSRLRADDLPNCLRDLDSGEVDFVIAYAGAEGPEPGAPSSLVIGADRLIPVCKPAEDGAPLYRFDAGGPRVPHLRFGDGVPIGRHLSPMFEAHRLSERLRPVYQNAMVGALRIRARAGEGVAWLPRSLVQPDIEGGLLVRTGPEAWAVDLSIRLFRNAERATRTTRAVWNFLEARQSALLVPAE